VADQCDDCCDKGNLRFVDILKKTRMLPIGKERAAWGRCSMELRSLASQALLAQAQMAQTQMSMAAVKQANEVQKQVADMLARNAATVAPAENMQKGGFSTYV